MKPGTKSSDMLILWNIWDTTLRTALEGNRRFGDRIIAGTFFICGDNGEDFCSLTDEQCEKYVREFAEPHEITQHEVENDMGCLIIGF